MPQIDSDSLSNFLFENVDVRGEIVHLDATWKQVIDRHEYPPVLRNLLGEMMAAAVLLIGTIKFKGRLTLQLKGDGPVTLGLVECTSERLLRGLIHWHGDVDQAAGLGSLLGKGVLAITLEQDPQGKKDKAERYQGIVEVIGDSLAQSLEYYLKNSEQLETRLWLTADEQAAAGMLLQRMPAKQTENPLDEDAWPRVVYLADTVKDDELLSLPAADIIHRLFNEEDVRLFSAVPVAFRCACSRERVKNTLRMLGEDDVQSILAEEGAVNVDCEFCRQHYEFDAVDIAALFASAVVSAAPRTSQ
jgi:molecular chaperone Hsp33